MERYVPIIRQCFLEYQIPFNLSSGFGLKQSPLIRTFLNTLSLIEKGFEFREVLQLLNLSFIKKPATYNPDLLYRLFAEERIRYLSKERLMNLANSIKIKNNHSEEKPDEFNNIFHQLSILSGLLKFLFEFPKKTTASGFRSSFIKTLKQYGLLVWYQNSSN
jgi:ATP-dependent helicase/DNAse subunit B